MASFSPTQNYNMGQSMLVCQLQGWNISNSWGFITFHRWSSFGHSSAYHCIAVIMVPFFLSQSTKSGNECVKSIEMDHSHTISLCCSPRLEALSTTKLHKLLMVYRSFHEKTCEVVRIY